jgi:hypothetical protein
MNAAHSDDVIAVQAEALYLINLMVAPGLAFVGLLWLARRHGRSASPLVRCHLRQTIAASLWAGTLLLAVTLMIAALGSINAPATWMVLILYFTCVHSTLILFGVFGLVRAMAGQLYVYPLIGVRKW